MNKEITPEISGKKLNVWYPFSRDETFNQKFVALVKFNSHKGMEYKLMYCNGIVWADYPNMNRTLTLLVSEFMPIQFN